MKKVLVFHSWGIGDLIMTTPMLNSLYESGYSVDLVLTSKVNKSVVKEAPFLENIFFINSLFDLFKFYKKYEYFIITAGTNPKKAKLLNLIIGAKRVYASFQKSAIHRIELNLDMVDELLSKKIYKSYVYLNNNEEILKKYLSKNKKNIGFAIGSGYKQKFKRWDIEKFIKLMKMFDENKMIFIGPEEKELKNKLENQENIKIVQENFEDSVKLISNLDFLVGNDNGLMHVGYSLGIRTFTIFGMSDEKESGGYDNNKNHNIYLDLDCRPCFHTKYKKIRCVDYKCLNNLSVDFVFNEIKKYEHN
jgi:ADP-heptose:LPS heptosyltransferase